MALNVGAIRTALATKIAAAYSGSFSINTHDYPPEAPMLPCVLIRTAPGDGAINYHETFGTNGQAHVDLEVEVRIPGWDVDAAKTCDKVLSTGTDESMFDAVAAMDGGTPYALSGLPGVAAVIVSASGPQKVTNGEGSMEWMSVRFKLTAYTAR